MNTNPWHDTDRVLPPDGEIVEVRNGEYVQYLKRSGRLWWLADGSMYVYFTPMSWRHVKPTHLLAEPGAQHALCGLKDPLPSVWVKYAQDHIDGYGMLICPACDAKERAGT